MASPEFPGTGRCSAFLTYIVQEVLEGRASASFARLGPDFLVHLRDEIKERVLQPRDKERIIESLRKAGLRAPDDQGVALAGDPTIGR
jgi:hypothetical protein